MGETRPAHCGIYLESLRSSDRSISTAQSLRDGYRFLAFLDPQNVGAARPRV
jgi:hypothetical protein